MPQVHAKMARSLHAARGTLTDRTAHAHISAGLHLPGQFCRQPPNPVPPPFRSPSSQAPYNPLLKPYFRLSVTTTGIRPVALPSPPPPPAPLPKPSPAPGAQATGKALGTLQNPIDIDSFPYLGPRVSVRH